MKKGRMKVRVTSHQVVLNDKMRAHTARRTASGGGTCQSSCSHVSMDQVS